MSSSPLGGYSLTSYKNHRKGNIISTWKLENKVAQRCIFSQQPKIQWDWQRELHEEISLNFSVVSKVSCCWRVSLTSSSRQMDSQLSAITGCFAEFWNTMNNHLAAPKGTADKILHHSARRFVLFCSFIPTADGRHCQLSPSTCWINMCIYIKGTRNRNYCLESYSYHS